MLKKYCLARLLSCAVCLCLSVVAVPVRNNAWLVHDREVHAVDTLDIPGMPIRLGNATLKNRGAAAEFRATFYNMSDAKLTNVRLRLFMFRSSGNLTQTEDLWDALELAPHTSKDLSFQLTRNIVPAHRLIAVIQSVNSEGGVWEVEDDKLLPAIKALTFNRQYSSLTAVYEPDISLDTEDKVEIFTSSIQQLRREPNLVNFFSIRGDQNIVVMSDDLDKTMTSALIDKKLEFLTSTEIQAKANQEGEVYYLKFESLTVEGSKVLVSATYSNRVRAGKTFRPCCGAFTLTYYNKDGGWQLIETKTSGL